MADVNAVTQTAAAAAESMSNPIVGELIDLLQLEGGVLLPTAYIRSESCVVDQRDLLR